MPLTSLALNHMAEITQGVIWEFLGKLAQLMDKTLPQQTLALCNQPTFWPVVEEAFVLYLSWLESMWSNRMTQAEFNHRLEQVHC